MKIPTKLTQRDPRNRAHLKAALELISELADAYALEEAARFVSRHGAQLHRKLMITNQVQPHDYVISGFFFLEEGLLFRDNLIKTCCVCGAALQIRPQSNTGKPCICCYCMADRLIAEYWREHQAATPDAQPQ